MYAAARAARTLSGRRIGLLRLFSRVLLLSPARRSPPAAYFPVRHFNQADKLVVPKNVRMPAKNNRLAKKFKGQPLTCFTYPSPKTHTTPKEFDMHNNMKHPGSKYFCLCKSGYATPKLLQEHQDKKVCSYFSGQNTADVGGDASGDAAGDASGGDGDATDWDNYE